MPRCIKALKFEQNKVLITMPEATRNMGVTARNLWPSRTWCSLLIMYHNSQVCIPKSIS